MAAINNTAAQFFVAPGGEVTPRAAPIDFATRRAVFDRDGGRCRQCRAEVRLFRRFAGDPFVGEVDHIIPRSRGGQNDPRNLMLLCRQCNRQKSNR